MYSYMNKKLFQVPSFSKIPVCRDLMIPQEVKVFMEFVLSIHLLEDFM